jgi:hypothetical protein
VNAVINTAIPQGGNAMKHSISTLVLATLVAIASLAQAHAQNNAARINVPFAFNSGSEHFAAGTYTVTTQGADILALRNDAQRGTRLSMVEFWSDASSAHAPASLTFRKYGHNYFLAEYSTNGETLTLVKSKKESNLAHEYALTQMNPSLVEVAALGK